jgi:hypothetical protein
MDVLRCLFGVPVGHVLRETNFRSWGGDQYEKWTYDESDASGELIARYERWEITTIRPLVTTDGWRKLDPAGNVLFENR